MARTCHTTRGATSLLLGGALLLASASGCGNSADSLIRGQIDAMNDLATAIENGAAEAELNKIKKRMESLGEQAKKLDPSKEEIKRLQEKYRDELAAATGRMMKATMSKIGAGLGGSGFPGIPSPTP